MPFCSTFLERLRLELLVVDQLGGFLVDQQLHARRAIFILRSLLLAAAEVLEHALDLRGQVLHAGRRHDLDARRDGARPRSRSPCRRVRPRAASCGTSGGSRCRFRCGSRAERPTRAPAAAARRARVPRRRPSRGARTLLHRLLAVMLDRRLGEVADDGVDVAADVADLGELGRLDLDEGRVGQPRQAPRDLGLADAGRPDHQDVLGRDLGAQRLGHLLAAPAVAQRDGHGALGARLADDVLVEFGDDFLRGHGDMISRKAMNVRLGHRVLQAEASGEMSGRAGRNRRLRRPAGLATGQSRVSIVCDWLV
jgi:hypothetical protein